MQLFEEALKAFVAAHATLGLVFSDRVFPHKAKKDEQRASITYRMDQRQLDQIVVGKTGKEDRRYTLIVWGASYPTVKSNAELLLLAFNQVKQPIGEFLDVVCFAKEQRDISFDDQAELYGVELEVQFLFMNYQ